MEEFLQYMKTLRSQMNDVEDQAAKISVEEQMQLINVRTLEKDIHSAKSDMKQLKEDTEQMKKVKGEICSQILKKQRRIGSLDSDLSTLTQTLELIQRERTGLSTKLVEKRAHYTNVTGDMSTKLMQQQKWINSKQIGRELEEHELVKDKLDWQRGKAIADDILFTDKLGTDATKSFKTKLDLAKSQLDEIILLKSKLLMENNKMKQAVEDAKSRANDFKPELNAADITTLEEEYNALLSDKVGETDYLQSLENQVEKLKGIRHLVNCACGQEYTVAVRM